ncbi:hypothetical protein V5O48_013317 [Marasmius crinis-equi]|uniref:Shugoshin C-terminal domain-containing protein n=1 Tax=Marasmius crinis-equi TaxID=585013 RepID=A0ABR3F0E3_9AGAR
MSRRESRASLDARQNDALFEFENFKKKFLLANKHITKLNSTLSVRIEELNAQISTLYTENLRLRASEIALAAQLKREREKSRRIIAETEVAALGLTKHLSFLRQAFNIAEQAPQSPSPTPPKATRRPVSQNNSSPTSPIAPKLSQEPTIPRIHEDEEPPSSEDEEAMIVKLSPRRKAKAKARLSASRLPLPSRIASPPPGASASSVSLQIDFESIPQSTTKRKPSRRQSGLVIDTRVSGDSGCAAGSSSIPRPPSPAFGSPIRRAAGLAEKRDENAASQVGGKDIEREFDEIPVAVKKPKSSSKREKEKPAAVPEAAEKKKGRTREESDASEGGGEKKARLKDVTNSPPVNTPVDPAALSELEVAPTPAHASHLPTPSPPPYEVDGDVATAGRERRTRRSVNYAEPKLNTKMRKPDPPEGSTTTTTTTTSRKRTSTSTGVRSSVPSTHRPRTDESAINEEYAVATDARSSLECDEPARDRQGAPANLTSSNTLRRHKSRPVVIEDDEEEEDGGADADEEYVPSYGRSSWVNVGERRKGVKDRRATGGSGMPHSLDERRHSMAF